MLKDKVMFLLNRKCIIHIVFVFSWLSLSVSAQDDCPAINCDCANLPLSSWQSVCSNHENRIKKQCARNQGVPTDYCSVHGPQASPVPLALKLSDVEVLPKKQIDDTNKKVAAMYWSSHTDMGLTRTRIEKGFYGQAQEMLKIMDQNIDSLFKVQQQITTSWISYEKKSNAVDAWRDYSEDTESLAEKLYQFGTELWQQYHSLEDKKAKKAYKVLAFRVLRMSGKTYEHAAFAYARGKKESDAAKLWKVASDVSNTILQYKQEVKAEEKHIKFYRYQTAARLHRASYYWTIEERETDAKNTLRASQEFVKNSEELNELTK